MKKKRFFIFLLLFLFSFNQLSRAEKGEKVPGFTYFDIELFSASLTKGYPLVSGIFLDAYTGKFLIHLGVFGAYLSPATFLATESGIGIPLYSSYQRNIETWRLAEIFSTYEATYYVMRRNYSDKIKLTLLELGIIKVWDFYYEEYVGDYGDKDIFGTTYDDMTEYGVKAKDMIIYGGIKILHVLNTMLTRDEITFYARVLIGIADRTAEIWTYYDEPTYTPTQKGVTTIGFDAGIRYFFGLLRVGLYNNQFYLNAGFRIPFTLGF